jgi:methionine-rich copper-binding protein CopC
VKWTRILETLIAASICALTSQPAFALELVAAEPSVNSTLTTAPSAVTLTFSSEVTETGGLLSVRAPSGMSVDDGSILIDGTNVLVGLKQLSESGKYIVTYQIMDLDGEVLSGNYTFTYDAPAEISSPTTSPSPSVIIEENQESPAAVTGKSSRATDIFMVGLLATSFLVLIFIGRSLRKPKNKKRKKR